MMSLQFPLVLLIALVTGASPVTNASGRVAPETTAANVQGRNAMCPVLPDEPVDPDIHAEFESRTVYFCCQRCRRDFLRDPEQYRDSLIRVSLATIGNATADQDSPVDQKAERPGGATDDIDAADRNPEQLLPEMGDEHDQLEHDHTHDHAMGHSKAVTTARVVQWLGRFHPIVIHVPIGLLLAGALAELLAMLTGAEWLGNAARFCVLVGALGALAAAPLGWANAAFAGYTDELAGTLFLHRWIGTATAGLALATAVASERMRRGGSGSTVWAYRAGLFVTAGLIGLTGHLGGTLIYGTGYFQW